MYKLCVLLVLLGCGSGKNIKETTETVSRIAAAEIITVKENITAPMDAVIFVPEVSGRIEDFKQKISTPTGVFAIEKNKEGITVTVQQEEIRSKDSIYKSSTNSEKYKNKEYKELKTVVRWSKFQWFLLLFFIGILVYYLYKIFRFLKLI